MLDMNLHSMFRKECQFICIAICFVGLPPMSEFLVVLQTMPQWACFRGDWGKAPIYATSHGDFSSDDETISTGEQAAQVLQSHFDHEGDNIRPIGGIPMET